MLGQLKASFNRTLNLGAHRSRACKRDKRLKRGAMRACNSRNQHESARSWHGREDRSSAPYDVAKSRPVQRTRVRALAKAPLLLDVTTLDVDTRFICARLSRADD
jgi:hypothetical protein